MVTDTRGLYTVSVGTETKTCNCMSFAREVAYKLLRDRGEGIAYIRLNGTLTGEVVRYRVGVTEYREHDRACETEHDVRLVHLFQLRSDGRLGKYLGSVKQ